MKMSTEEYELLIFGAYARWCESVTTNLHEFQKVLASSAVNKWFMMEYAKCEKDFEQMTARYTDSDSIIAEDYKRCYAESTYRMFNIRPTVLLAEIKKPTTGAGMKVGGVRIHSLNFNQN